MRRSLGFGEPVAARSTLTSQATHIDHADTFSLLAELALALAGFTGVAGAFGGRDRSYSSGDLIRIESIFLSAGSVLLGTLCALTLCGAGFSDAAAYEWSSLVAASMLSPFFYRLTPRAIKLARDTAATTCSPELCALPVTKGRAMAIGGEVCDCATRETPLHSTFSWPIAKAERDLR